MWAVARAEWAQKWNETMERTNGAHKWNETMERSYGAIKRIPRGGGTDIEHTTAVQARGRLGTVV